MSSELQKANKLFEEEKYVQAVKIYEKIKGDQILPSICYEYNLAKCIQLSTIKPNTKREQIALKRTQALNREHLHPKKDKEILNRCDLNSFNNGVLIGWAINYQSADRPVKISIYVNSKLDGSVLCDSYRKDLELNGIGDGLGRYGFQYQLKTNYENENALEISCRLDENRDFDSGRSFLRIDLHDKMKSNLSSYCDTIRRIYQENIFKDYRILNSSLLQKKEFKNQSTKVSIIMPTYNRKDIILRAIDSILSQSYKNWELIICDDGSTDDTYLHVRQHTNDKRIRYLILDHGGVSNARNAGLEASSGDYLAFLDSDNTWHSQFLYLMLSYISAGNLDAAYCQIAIKGQDEEIKGYRGDIFSWQSCLKKNYIDMNCFVHKANSRALKDNIISNERFDVKLKRLVDWDYILRVTKNIDVSFCPLPLVSYYDGDDYQRITKTVYTEGDKIQEFIKSIQSKHFDDIYGENLDKLTFFNIADKLRKEVSNSIESKSILYYFPDYTSTNSYQNLFYGPLKKEFDVKSCNLDDLISGEIENIHRIDYLNSSKIFHLHWHNAFFNNNDTSSSMRLKAKSTIKKLEMLKQTGFKLVWTLHNIKSHESRHILHEIEFIKDIIKLSDHIIVHDLATVEIARPWYKLPLSKIIVCPHAGYQASISKQNYCQAINKLKEEYSIPEKSIIFGAIGQIRTYKNLELLVQVFLNVSKKYENIFLFIAGKPVHCDTKFLEDAARTNKNILLQLGFISDDNLFDYMQDIDCLILNYSSVLTSGSYHLAETVGCPVICPDQGILSHHIENCDAVFGFSSGEKDLEYTIDNFIEAFKRQDTTLSKIILAKSSQVSWDLSANSFFLNLQLAKQYKHAIIKYSNICHSWFLNKSFENYVKKSEIIAIVIHYSNTKDTLEIVKSLESQTQKVDIVVICNSDSPADFQLLTTSLLNIPVAQKHVNGGYAAGVNLGLHISIKYNYDYFWILNPDLEMELNTAQRFKTALEAHKSINIVGCTLTGFGAENSEKIKFCGGEINRDFKNIGTKHIYDGSTIDDLPDSPFQCDYLTGANIFGRTSTLDLLGFFPEHLFLYFEETIWIDQYVQKTGDRPWILPQVFIKNKKRSENSSLPTTYYFYYMIRNWLIFAYQINQSYDYSTELPDSLRYFISSWLKKIKDKHPSLLDNYVNIASCAFEHGLLRHAGINSDIQGFAIGWTEKYGINSLINEIVKSKHY